MGITFTKVDLKAKDCWRTGQLIKLVIAAAACGGIFLIVKGIDMDKHIFYAVAAVLCLFIVYRIIALILFPTIEYAQWGYYIDEEKIVIKHGIFFINTTVIPIIRIQNITMNQGPINRMMDVYNVEIALASGNKDILGLSQPVAEEIVENLRVRLYKRLEERGEL